MGLEGFSYLWTAPPGKYVLERSVVEGEAYVLIRCPEESAVVLVDDDELNDQVTQRMVAAAVPVVEG